MEYFQIIQLVFDLLHHFECYQSEQHHQCVLLYHHSCLHYHLKIQLGLDRGYNHNHPFHSVLKQKRIFRYYSKFIESSKYRYKGATNKFHLNFFPFVQLENWWAAEFESAASSYRTDIESAHCHHGRGCWADDSPVS